MNNKEFANPSILVGKTIKSIEVTGFRVEIETQDGYEFIYYPSDGGYSSWECSEKENGNLGNFSMT